MGNHGNKTDLELLITNNFNIGSRLLSRQMYSEALKVGPFYSDGTESKLKSLSVEGSCYS